MNGVEKLELPCHGVEVKDRGSGRWRWEMSLLHESKQGPLVRSLQGLRVDSLFRLVSLRNSVVALSHRSGLPIRDADMKWEFQVPVGRLEFPNSRA